jgi:Lipid A 3-O-deacylase (PagL)
MRAARLAVGVCILTAVSGPLFAQSAVDKRRSEWMLAGGFGWTIGTGPSDPDLQYVALFPELAWPVKPHVSYIVTGYASRWFPRRGWVAGIFPVGGRLELVRGRRNAPYVSASVGVGWTDLTELDEIDRRFNFLAEWGAGIRHRTPGGRDWFAEFRYLHVSNFGTSGNNWGLNTLLVVVGRQL